jgi:hypothetical protein
VPFTATHGPTAEVDWRCGHAQHENRLKRPAKKNGPSTSPAPSGNGCKIVGDTGWGGGGGGGGCGCGVVAVRQVNGQFGHSQCAPHGVAERFEHSPACFERSPEPLQMEHEGGQGEPAGVAQLDQSSPHLSWLQQGMVLAAECDAAAKHTHAAKDMPEMQSPRPAQLCRTPCKLLRSRITTLSSTLSQKSTTGRRHYLRLHCPGAGNLSLTNTASAGPWQP